eukprot:1138504-Pelagomonas_calceolata.AAC.4
MDSQEPLPQTSLSRGAVSRAALHLVGKYIDTSTTPNTQRQISDNYVEDFQANQGAGALELACCTHRGAMNRCSSFCHLGRKSLSLQAAMSGALLCITASLTLGYVSACRCKLRLGEHHCASPPYPAPCMAASIAAAHGLQKRDMPGTVEQPSHTYIHTHDGQSCSWQPLPFQTCQDLADAQMLQLKTCASTEGTGHAADLREADLCFKQQQ